MPVILLAPSAEAVPVLLRLGCGSQHRQHGGEFLKNLRYGAGHAVTFRPGGLGLLRDLGHSPELRSGSFAGTAVIPHRHAYGGTGNPPTGAVPVTAQPRSAMDPSGGGRRPVHMGTA